MTVPARPGPWFGVCGLYTALNRGGGSPLRGPRGRTAVAPPTWGRTVLLLSPLSTEFPLNFVFF